MLVNKRTNMGYYLCLSSAPFFSTLTVHEKVKCPGQLLLTNSDNNAFSFFQRSHIFTTDDVHMSISRKDICILQFVFHVVVQYLSSSIHYIIACRPTFMTVLIILQVGAGICNVLVHILV